MKQYTKTITVQAVQWTGENLKEIELFCLNHAPRSRVSLGKYDNSVYVGLCENAKVGDYLTNVPGFYKVVAVTNKDFLRDYKEVTE